MRNSFKVLTIPSKICNSERYSVIVGNSGTPLQKVTDLYCNHDYYGSTNPTNFKHITYYLFLHA